MKIIILLIGILAAINVVILAFTSNIHQGHFVQGAVAVALILYAVFYDKTPFKLHVAIWTAGFAAIAFAGFLAVYGRLGSVDHTEDVVIVLGAGLRGEEPGTHLARRLDTAITYLNQNQDALVVVTGGLGAGRTITEAESMERYMVARGIAHERIIQEGLSTTTHENLIFANEILEDYFPDGFHGVLVSNDFHIYRATRMARQLNISVTPLGAPTPTFTIPINYLREMFAVVHMWVFR
ncbi:MAG: YdcF family protein [Defluviitaleaceae bacterium]|nr:YdcF family protein [Defluviitaleaceae bacterium]